MNNHQLYQLLRVPTKTNQNNYCNNWSLFVFTVLNEEDVHLQLSPSSVDFTTATTATNVQKLNANANNANDIMDIDPKNGENMIWQQKAAHVLANFRPGIAMQPQPKRHQ
jgi:hypothetical protein